MLLTFILAMRSTFEGSKSNFLGSLNVLPFSIGSNALEKPNINPRNP
jgi:hypothetical protein